MKIYTSDTNSLLVDKITTELATLAEKNTFENYILIVPEKFSVSMEKLLLKKTKSGAIMNVQVVTLSRLLYKLLPSTNNYLSAVMGVMATKRVIMEHLDDLVCYKKTAKTIGFAENIYDTISELKNSKVTPEDYYKKNKTGTSLDIKLHDIFMLYKAYDEYLKKENLVDAADRFDLLTEQIYMSDYIKSSNVYVFGYDSSTRSGLTVFEAIIKQAKTVTLACLDNSGKANSYVCPPEMLNNYLEIADRLYIKPIVVKLSTGKVSLATHIANNAYAYPYSRMVTSGEIRLFEAKTVMEELSVVAEDIARKIKQDKLRYRDFAVVCPDVSGYKDFVRRVFDDYNLPHFVDSPEKLSEHPLSEFVETALNVIRKNYLSDEIKILFSNIFCGVSAVEFSKFDNYVVKFAINYDDFNKPFVYKTQDPQDQLIAEQVRARVVAKINSVKEIIAKARTAKEINDAIRLLFSLFEVDKTLDEFEQALTKIGKLALESASRQVKEKIENLMIGAEKIFGNTKISFEEYFAVLQAGIRSETISLIPVTVDNVFVGDITSSKFFGVRELYIIGAVDGAVPFVKDDCGIIVDKELEMISATLGKKIEPTIRTINQREKFKLINILQEFSGSLTVSYSRIGLSGDEQRASSLVRELTKIFYLGDKSKPLEIMTTEWLDKLCGLLPVQKRQDKLAHEFATTTVATEWLADKFRGLRQGKTIEDREGIDSLYAVLRDIGDTRTKKFLNEVVEDNPPVALKHAKDLYFKNGKTSVSQMENFFACPFKFFANFGLRLKPRDEAYLKSVDYGNVLHKIAELYMRNIKKFEIDSGRPITEKQKELESMINFVFSEEKLKTANNKHMLIQLKKEAFRLIDALTYQYRNSNFKPVAEELVFGKNSKVPGIKLTKNVAVEGKIDRVDACGDFFRVIDYKTGHIDLTPKTTYYGQKVQLFMYLAALNNTGARPAGAFYLPIRNVFIDENQGTNFSTYKLTGYYNYSPDAVKHMDRRLSPDNSKSDIVNIAVSSSKANRETGTIQPIGNFGFSDEELVALSDYTKKICAQAVDEILAGFTSATPMEQDGRTPCEFCEFRTACGRDFNSTKDIRKQLANIKFENIMQKRNENGEQDQ